MVLVRHGENGDFQFVERVEWIPSIGAEYFALGIDGISLLLILLTTVLGFHGGPVILDGD